MKTNFSNQFVHDSVSHKILVMYEVPLHVSTVFIG